MSAPFALGWRLGIYVSSPVSAAGIANGIAGGGTFITFPTLLGVGVPALHRQHLHHGRGGAELHRVTSGLSPAVAAARATHSLAGARLRARAPLRGCALLLAGSSSTFREVVPWLIGAGTVLFALSPIITRSLAHVDTEHSGARRVGLYLGIFVASVYGGYFGAGMGILLLAVMALTLPVEIDELQGLRNALSLIINVVAALDLRRPRHLAVEDVSCCSSGTSIGGWLGAMLVVRLSPALVRAILVIVVGAATTIKLAIG